MATVESQILVRIKALIEGLPQLAAFSAFLKNTQKAAGGAGQSTQKFATGATVLRAALAPLKGLGGLIAGVFSQMARQIQFAAASLAIFIASSPALIFGLMIKEGLSFNSVMEQQQIGLAALIQSTNTLFHKDQPNKPLTGIEAYNAATVIAKASTDRLSVKLIPLAATIEELLPVFNQIVTAGASAGLTLEQTENVFVDLAAAAQVVNIPLEKLGTGIRLFLNGTARATTVLATALFGNAQAANEWVKEHKKIGDLSEALHIKLEAFRLAMITSESSFATLASNTKDVFQRLAAIATSGLFEKLKKGLVLILQSFYDLKTLTVKPEFETLFDFINNSLTKVGDFIVYIVEMTIEYLRDIAIYVQDNQAYVQAILNDLLNIATQLGGILGDVASILGNVEGARKETADWHTILGFAAITIGTIRDLFNIILGLIQIFGGLVVTAMLYPLEGVLRVLGLISDTAANAANAIAAARGGVRNFMESGAVRTVSGFTFQNGQSATEKFLNGNGTIPSTQKPKVDNNFLTKLNKNVGGAGKKGGGRGDGGEQQAANKLAESLRSLKDSNLDLTLTKFEQRISRVKFLFAQAQSALDRQLKDHLISISDYYSARLQVEQGALNADIAQQEAGRDHDIATIEAKITELESKKKALAKNTKLNPTARKDQTEAFDNEIQVQRNKLKEVELKTDEKIAELRGEITAAGFQNLQDEKFALRELQDAIDEIDDSVSDLNGRTAAAAGNRIDRQFRDVLARTEKEFGKDSTQLALINAYVEFLKVKEKVAQRLDEYAQSNALKALEVNELEFQLNTGKLTQVEYERQLNVLNEAYYQKQLQILEAAALLPGMTREQSLALQEALAALKASHVTVDSLASSINGSLRDAASGFVDTMLEGNTDIVTNFRKTASAMLIQMSKLIVQALIMSAIFKALGISSGSTGGAGGWLSGILGGGVAKKADGGIMSGPGTGTSDSIPAMLSHGEGVIPARSVTKYGPGMIKSIINGSFVPRHGALRLATGAIIGPGGGASAGGGNVRNINVLDPNLLEDYVNSASGERTMLNVISRNPGKVKQSLGLA